MSKYMFSFIGTGNMGSSLAKAVAKSVGGENIVLADKDTSKAELLAEKIGACALEIKEAVKESDFIFLGVKPQVLDLLFEEIAPVLAERESRFVLVSMAAGVCIDDIKKKSGKDYPIIRIMPNTPVEVENGMVLYCCSKGVSQEEENIFKSALENACLLDKIDEDLIDAASAVSGCGPAFVYMYAQALAEAGEKCGLLREKALMYAAQTLIGAGEMILKTKIDPETLKNNVCSPGGSTVEGVKVLDNSSFKADVIDAVKASYKRTKELGK